jgi:ankyrin repeat domain-containing protein 50
LQIKQLLQLSSEEAIRDRLGKLPVDLKDAYDGIFENISNQNRHDRDLTDRAFMWVLCAARPFKSTQLLSAIQLSICENDSIQVHSPITEATLLHLCQHLLVIDSKLSVWRFSHLSAREYIEEHHWNLQRANSHVTKVCLGYLTEWYKDADAKSIYEILINNKHDSLHQYINFHWINHVQAQEALYHESAITRLLESFLGPPMCSSKSYQSWHSNLQKSSRYSRPRTSYFYFLHDTQIGPEHTAIFLVCGTSIYNLLKDWWETPEIDISLTFNGFNLLAVVGSPLLCQHLVKQGLQVNQQVQNGSYGSALAAAAAAAADIALFSRDTVKYLVEAGAEVNMQIQNGSYGSALAAAAAAAAAAESDIKTVKYLVEAGAEVNMQIQNGPYGSALAAAAAAVANNLFSDIKIVKYLIKVGADINMQIQNGSYGSALATAAAVSPHFSGRDTVKYLVEAGAEVNMQIQNGSYGSALAAAVARPDWYLDREVIKYLVEEAGAEINMQIQNGSYGSALAAAAAAAASSRVSSTEVVKYLVEAGAEVDMKIQNAAQ